MRNRYQKLQPTRNNYAKALHSLRQPTGDRPRQLNPDTLPAVTLDQQRLMPDYAKSLTYNKSANRHRRGFGRQLSDFSQTLQTLGARAARVGQLLQPPEVEPHIPFLSYDETRNFLRQHGSAGEHSLREEASAWPDTHANVPYSLHATEAGVSMRIAHQDWDGHGQIVAMRQALGFTAQESDDPWTSVQVVSYNSINTRFAERVEQINNYDLSLSVGRLVLFRY